MDYNGINMVVLFGLFAVSMVAITIMFAKMMKE